MIIQVLLLCTSVQVTLSQKLYCHKTLAHDYSWCAHRTDTAAPCTGNSMKPLINNFICNNTITVATVNIYPQNNTLKGFVQGLTEHCCGNCQNLKFEKTYGGPQELSDSLNNDTANYDIIYPVLGYYLEKELFGRFFIPFIPARSALFIINQKTKAETMKDLLTACVNLWPLLTICLFMAFIAGFIGWLMDTWRNVEEFPRPFLSGVYEGFWWSFVSMTTVGYGDKTPRSNCARLFSIAWILIGITICSMFTASLTTAITEASESPSNDIKSRKVGVLSNRLLDPAFAIKKSGLVSEVSHSLHYLFDALDSKKIDGILLDSSSAKQLLVDFNVNNYLVTEKDFSAEGLAYGALVRTIHQYDYFNSFMKDNHVLFETCLDMDKGKHKDDGIDINIFSPKGGLFWPSFIVTMSCIFLICIFGVIYEQHRKKKKSQVEIVKKGKSQRSPGTEKGETVNEKENDKEVVMKQIYALLEQLNKDPSKTESLIS